jgi:hypothetical protein
MTTWTHCGQDWTTKCCGECGEKRVAIAALKARKDAK